MDHEDKNLEYNLQATQNLMENLQIASGGVVSDVVNFGGGGDCGLVAGDGGSIVGGKYEEHEDDDHEEWKYREEVQQSEKLKVGGGGGEVGGVTAAEFGSGDGFGIVDGGGFDFGRGNQAGDFAVGSNGSQIHHGDDEDDECLVGNNGLEDEDVHAPLTPKDAKYCFEGEEILRPDSSGFKIAADEEEDFEVNKNDGDFSSTSNATTTDENSTTGGGRNEEISALASGAGVAEDLLKVEMKIVAPVDPFQQEVIEYDDEEEPSSLATNGTSSLSGENPEKPPQKPSFGADFVAATSAAFADDFDADKENVNSVHSPLNPDAAEFVPSFGGSPASPILSAAAPAFDVAQHHRAQLLGECGDDLVAQSPRKGRGSNMDAIALPAENVFEQEANERPHELEQEAANAAAMLVGDGALPTEQHQHQEAGEMQLHLENGTSEVDEIASAVSASADILDFGLPRSPNSFIDHGPETSVDLFGDIMAGVGEVSSAGLNEDIDPMKQSIYVAEEPIEELLNTVQLLPTSSSDDAEDDEDSANNSFIVEKEKQQLETEMSDFADALVIDKELLNVEEKEHVSHSPSTEEIGDLLAEAFSGTAAKDLPRDDDGLNMEIDMNNAAHMQGSFYVQPSSAAHEQDEEEQHMEVEMEQSPNAAAPNDAERLCFNADRSAFSADDEVSFVETSRVAAPEEAELFPMSAGTDTNFATQLSAAPTLDVAPTLLAEQQLVAQLKQSTDNLNQFETKLDDMHLSASNLVTEEEASADAAADNGRLLQVEEEVAKIATTIVGNANPFFSQEFEEQHQQEPLVHEYQQNQHQEQHEISHHEHPPFDYESNLHEQQQQQFNIEPEITQIKAQPPQHLFEAAESAFDIAAPSVEAAFEAVPEAASEAPTELFSTPPPAADPFAALEEPILATTSEAAALPEPSLIEADLLEPAAEVVAAAEPAAVFAETAAEAKEEVVIAAVAAVAATTAAVAAAAAITTAAKKPTDAKKPAAAAAAGRTSGGTVKPKVGSDAAKKTAGSGSAVKSTAGAAASKNAAARPRTAPAPTGIAAKRTAASNTAAAAAAKPTPAARRPLTASGPLTAARTGQVTKTAAATSSSTTTKTTMPRAAASGAKMLAARKTATAAASTTASATTTNGSACKPRPTTAPAKPTSLGLASSAAAKPKLSSPRATLTSQLRKPPVGGTGAATAKSPLKPPSANGVAVGASRATSSTLSSTLASRATKTTSAASSGSTSTTTTTTTKTFTARPAPKTSSTTTTTSTTRRLTVGGTPTSKTTTTAASGVRKTASPMKPLPGRLSPSKTAGGPLKSKAKEAAVPPKGSTPIRIMKPKPAETPAVVVAEQEQASAQQVQLNGSEENGTHLAENGEQAGGGDEFLMKTGAAISLLDA